MNRSRASDVTNCMAANRLTQRYDVTVNLINPRQVFVPRLRLHQLVDGSHDAVVDYREILLGPLGTSNGSTAIRHNTFGYGATEAATLANRLGTRSVGT